MFHNYDPYDELEQVKALAYKLADAHNITQQQLANVNEHLRLQDKQLRRLKAELDLARADQHLGNISASRSRRD